MNFRNKRSNHQYYTYSHSNQHCDSTFSIQQNNRQLWLVRTSCEEHLKNATIVWTTIWQTIEKTSHHIHHWGRYPWPSLIKTLSMTFQNVNTLFYICLKTNKPILSIYFLLKQNFKFINPLAIMKVLHTLVITGTITACGEDFVVVLCACFWVV